MSRGVPFLVTEGQFVQVLPIGPCPTCTDDFKRGIPPVVFAEIHQPYGSAVAVGVDHFHKDSFAENEVHQESLRLKPVSLIMLRCVFSGQSDLRLRKTALNEYGISVKDFDHNAEEILFRSGS